jgi:hypothetical protein
MHEIWLCCRNTESEIFIVFIYRPAVSVVVYTEILRAHFIRNLAVLAYDVETPNLKYLLSLFTDKQ